MLEVLNFDGVELRCVLTSSPHKTTKGTILQFANEKSNRPLGKECNTLLVGFPIRNMRILYVENVTYMCGFIPWVGKHGSTSMMVRYLYDVFFL